MNRELTLCQRVVQHAQEQPEQVAVATSQWQLTYRELALGMEGMADQLKGDGIGQGTPLPFTATPTPDFLFRYLATQSIGAIAVPLDPRTAPKNRAHILDQLAHMSKRYDGASDILFTSGTTGMPKGVVLTHQATLCAALQTNNFIGNGPEDREVVPLPLNHSFGLGRLRCNLLLGSTTLLCNGLQRISEFFALIERWNATGVALVPAMIAILLRLAEPKLAELSPQIGYMEIGSAPMRREHKERLIALFPNARICMHYGLTEASRAAFLCFQESPDHLDSIGRPTPGVEIRIDGANGEVGPLLVRGGMVMQEYWNDRQATQERLQGGWLNTGDIGRVDADGFLYLAGRVSDLIHVGGYKVAPLEIDGALEDHPAIEECACVGIPDPDEICGEIVRAYLVSREVDCRPSPRDLVAFLRERIEPYKVPAQFMWIEEIPKTASGKIQRHLLTELER